MTEGILGRTRPGFYMNDILRRKDKMIRWVKRDSLGEKQYEPVKMIKIVTEDGSEVEVTLVKNTIRFSTTFGGMLVRPVVSNVVEITVGKEADF